jgi:hypothetical protein
MVSQMRSVSHIASAAVSQIQIERPEPSLDSHRSSDHPRTNQCHLSIPRPDLVSTEDEDANASHPSEHNVELGDPNSQIARLALSKRATKAEEGLAERSRRVRARNTIPGSSSRPRETPRGMDTRKHSQILCWVLLHIIPTGVLQCFLLTGQSRSVSIANQWYSPDLCRFYGGYFYDGVSGCSGAACSGRWLCRRV